MTCIDGTEDHDWQAPPHAITAAKADHKLAVLVVCQRCGAQGLAGGTYFEKREAADVAHADHHRTG